MSPSPQLAPAGSSSYNSNTMSVGDGTWDASRNSFLLPNLVGLNFDTMRYNGMGNRFREMPGYFNLIQAHGILAAITFLFIVPAAILTVRFHSRNPRSALRIHIWLQIMTVLLTTAIIILGFIAVGPARNLSNPHHGVGLAIYVLVLAQFIGGWWMHRKERMQRRIYEPLKVMLHHWLGRAIALLGLAQIPLGLTLYGSPLVLFILYALTVFALLIIYFILTYLRERRGGSDYSSQYDYGPGSAVDERRNERRNKRTGNLLKGALAGAGLYAVANRFRRRSTTEDRPPVRKTGEEAVGRRHSGSYLNEEKYSQSGRDLDKAAKWEDRLLKVAAPIGLAGVVERYYDRRYADRDSDPSQFGPPLGGETTISDDRYEGRRPTGGPMPARPPVPGTPGPYGRPLPGGPVPLNQPLPSGRHPLNRPASQRSSETYSDYPSASGEPRPERQSGHGVRDGLTTLGFLGVVRNIFNRRRNRRDDQRLEEEQESRIQGQHFTGDGRPPRLHRPGQASTISTDTSFSGAHPHEVNNIPPVPTGIYPGGAAAAGAAEAQRQRERRRQEELPLGGVPRPVAMPPIPPDPQGLFHPESSGSESYMSPSGRRHHRHHAGRNAAAAAIVGGATGLAAGEASSRRREQPRIQQAANVRNEQHDVQQAANVRNEQQEIHQATNVPEQQETQQTVNVGEPGASAAVKVRLHGDGRHVSLRRIPEEDARAEREARRQARRARGDSGSSLDGDGEDSRFRRREAQVQENAEAMRIESQRLAAARAQAQNPVVPPNFPAPPPIPESSTSALRPGAGNSSVSSPGEGVADEYASNRRRRRAERAQAMEARSGTGGAVAGPSRGGKTVGFT